ncbi:MAG: NAD(P)H-dependent oxidoreductase subunit E [Desulfobacterales bacterium]|nr:NAD(P)H-dependent oxidoreductase subunit E [Desulfobacterales bacterium]MCP4164241.1 NAD(P)H-dependent oxidoreductase subunit E [Deltaproteobacteria bacterium]
MMLDAHPTHPDIDFEMWGKLNDVIIEHHDSPGAVIPVLRLCQDIVGYLPVELIDYIARGLNLPRSQVFGVATFYSFFSLEPKGRHNIKVCTGTACYVKGIQSVVDTVSRTYDVEEEGTTEDRRFSLSAIRCLGACGLAPVVVVNEDIYGDVKADEIIEIVEKYE